MARRGCCAALLYRSGRQSQAHDEWTVAERRYLSEESMANLHTPTTTTTEEQPLAVTA